VDVENSGHFIQEEQPELVARTMIDFLQADYQRALKS
jgi:pimeloyl-ACP methyl ester carboxylesterase